MQNLILLTLPVDYRDVIYITLLVIIIALIVLAFFVIKLNARLNYLCKLIGILNSYATKGDLDKCYQNVKCRLRQFEDKINGKDKQQINLKKNTNTAKVQPTSQQKENQVAKVQPDNKGTQKAVPPVYYFGITNSKYFFNIYDSKNDNAFFKVSFDDESKKKGDFELLSINQLKSIDGIGEAVDIDYNDLEMKNARDFETLEKGHVEKNGNDNSWMISSPTKIRLK